MSKPICPDCERAGVKPSRIDIQGYTTTAVAIERFYDSDGQRHYHDPNIHTERYGCSNGHAWAERTITPCSVFECKWYLNRKTELFQ